MDDSEGAFSPKTSLLRPGCCKSHRVQKGGSQESLKNFLNNFLKNYLSPFEKFFKCNLLKNFLALVVTTVNGCVILNVHKGWGGDVVPSLAQKSQRMTNKIKTKKGH